MKLITILRVISVLVILSMAFWGGLDKEAIWAFILTPLFFIGKPWYHMFRKADATDTQK
ncbi:hypothetical protein [Bacillus thermotolerans]|uniref:hypothetical protein n=1 Tax=Bacillus thermotolerans TaxID=1221996 RepID=UPI0005920832|nr:hypothetical protein [Bacillus thermotolerans]KKB38997.1 hypothetical protein QY96_02878 [Bacillus thermotolerans]